MVDAIGYLSLKLSAKQLRPRLKKDCFDIFAYVHLIGVDEVNRQLRSSPTGPSIRDQLKALFGTETSAGVLDVLEFAPTLDEADRALVVRAVLDLFDPLCRTGSG